MNVCKSGHLHVWGFVCVCVLMSSVCMCAHGSASGVCDCKYVNVHDCALVYMQAHAHTCTLLNTHILVHMDTHSYTRTHSTQINSNTHIFSHSHILTNTQRHSCAQKHTCMYTNGNTHAYTHGHKCSPFHKCTSPNGHTHLCAHMCQHA